MKNRWFSTVLALAISFIFVPSTVFADTAADTNQQIPEAETIYDESISTDTINTDNDTVITDVENAPEEPAEELTDNIEDYHFELSQSKFFYDNSSHIPQVICSELEEGIDYSVEYEQEYVFNEEAGYGEYKDPCTPGTYKVYINGISPYSGSKELTFSIVETTLSLNKTSATLYRKGTLQLKASVENGNGETTFTTSNANVATVNTSGKVTAKAKGTAVITVRNGFASKQVRITVKNPSLNMNKAVIYVKGSKTLKITGKVGKATFKSSNTGVASVNKSGKITAKKKGTCTISVKTNGVTLKCKVTVKKPYLSKSSLSIVKNKTAKLKVVGLVGKATFKSSNKKIATVATNGTIKAKKKGTCTITVKANGFTLKCKVTVKNPPPVYVYTTRTGKRYHCDKDCWGLRNARALYKVEIGKAKKRGLTKCQVCY